MSAPPAPFAFVGRRTVLARLDRAYRAQRHVLLHAPAGTGKTMLIAELARTHRLVVAPACHCLGSLLETLEPAAGLAPDGLRMAARVHRLASRLPEIRQPIVVDNVARVPPRVAHLLRVLMLRQPVWFLARSLGPLDLGHVWPYLFLFERIDLPPFSLEETRAFLSGVDVPGSRRELLQSALRLHRLAAGHPGTLAALASEIGRRTYDLRTLEGLRLLALHARISVVQAQIAAG